MDRLKRIRGIASDIKVAIWALSESPREPGQKAIGGKEVLTKLRNMERFNARLRGSDNELGHTEDAQLKRVQRELATIRGNQKEMDSLDQPFDWARFPAHGLPWEANSFLLDMWVHDQELNAKRDSADPANVVSRPASWRKAKWWWKVNTAIPDPAGDLGMTREEFVYRTAEVLWLADWYENILGIPMDTSGNMAFLAYRGWDENNRERYQRALNEGRIKPLSSIMYTLDQDGNPTWVHLAPPGQQVVLDIKPPTSELEDQSREIVDRY